MISKKMIFELYIFLFQCYDPCFFTLNIFHHDVVRFSSRGFLCYVVTLLSWYREEILPPYTTPKLTVYRRVRETLL